MLLALHLHCSQIAPNKTLMLQQLALNHAAGQVMWVFSTLTLLAILQDPEVVSIGSQSLDPIASPENDTGTSSSTSMSLTTRICFAP